VQLDDPASIAGVDVRSADGHLLGRVTVVHVPEGGRRPLFAQIAKGRAADVESIVPLVQAHAEGRALVVPYSAERVETGPTVERDADLSLGEAAYIIGYYGAGSVDVAGRPLTERVSAVGDAGAEDPEVRRLPPIVVTRPGIQGDLPAGSDFGPPAGEL
jgi:hypothetical protein